MNEQVKNEILNQIRKNEVVATSYAGANIYTVRDGCEKALLVIENNYFVNENTISVRDGKTPITVSWKDTVTARKDMIEIVAAAQNKVMAREYAKTR